MYIFDANTCPFDHCSLGNSGRNSTATTLVSIGITEADSEVLASKGVTADCLKMIRTALPQDILQADTKAVAVLFAAAFPVFVASWSVLQNDLRRSRTAFIVLVLRQDAPGVGIRNDGSVESFLCSVEAFRALLCKNQSEVKLGDLCYRALEDICADNFLHCTQLLVRQLPALRDHRRPSCLLEMDVIMAHRGHATHLAAALRGCRLAENPNLMSIHVGLDDDLNPVVRDLIQSHP